VYWYRSRELEFTGYFSQDGDLVNCYNIPGLKQKFGIEYKLNEWQLFIDSSKRSLKAVLLHNGNNYTSVTIRNSVHLNGSYENLELILKKIEYTAHAWMVCGDMKVWCILCNSLIDPKKILLPPLHIKLGIMKQLFKALPKTGNCF
jgi:hypothetical protein